MAVICSSNILDKKADSHTKHYENENYIIRKLSPHDETIKSGLEGLVLSQAQLLTDMAEATEGLLTRQNANGKMLQSDLYRYAELWQITERYSTIPKLLRSHITLYSSRSRNNGFYINVLMYSIWSEVLKQYELFYKVKYKALSVMESSSSLISVKQSYKVW